MAEAVSASERTRQSQGLTCSNLVSLTPIVGTVEKTLREFLEALNLVCPPLY